LTSSDWLWLPNADDGEAKREGARPVPDRASDPGCSRLTNLPLQLGDIEALPPLLSRLGNEADTALRRERVVKVSPLCEGAGMGYVHSPIYGERAREGRE
jgi:hypothetical protein